ncbi:TIGR00296 family protein [Methanonatronarchaeum sp. AMET-Sl]|uniref:TIGR00296 family protein n=1 Tax=Methanonatronarchaeum sp. AMET-Sl TaxID=3037654 RepID=UPI00244DB8A7|nr:TIGR00296 family protein [Methanonatronarchaeum sp. AMET-Sl]WGI17255.1 TIGR00296 family protein [Methanonatronarchaeum sp. AMET-Sl]
MLDLDEAEVGVKLVRGCIESKLVNAEFDWDELDIPSVFNEKRGVFVTIRKDGDLRGCIGRPYPEQELKQALLDSAIGAAFNDPRFPEMSKEEFENSVIEITFLTRPVEVEKSGRDLLGEIEVGKHGLIVSSGARRGLLLPQVAVEHSWGPMEFLSETCMKAGLLPDAWLDPDTKVQKFKGQIFMEDKPGGEVKEIDIDEGC